MEQVILTIGGMTCGGCVKSISKVLHEVAGVQHADVDLNAASATVQFDPAQTNVAALIEVIEDAGFDAQAV